MNCRLMVVVMMAGMLLLQLAEVQADNDDCKYIPSGCDFVLSFMSVSQKVRLQPSCNRFVICYSCGLMYGIERRTCVDAFWKVASEVCIGDSRYFLCSNDGLLYLTKDFLDKSRDADRCYEDFCNESWITDCLPPRQ